MRLRCRREHLCLPVDLLEGSAAFLRLEKPKTARRGRGRIQHLKITDTAALYAAELSLAGLLPWNSLFSGSPAAYRKCWISLLYSFEIPSDLALTPGGLRGGAAVAAYRKGIPITELLWRMRLLQLATLESYLQECAAQTVLPRLPPRSLRKVRAFAKYFDFLFSPELPRPSAPS